MELLNDPTAPPLGIDLPPVQMRFRARTTFVQGVALQFDTPLIHPDADNLRVGDKESGLATANFIEAQAARTGRLIGICDRTVLNGRLGVMTVRGRTKMWVADSGSAGDALSVGGTLVSGNRIVAIALEAWSGNSLIEVLFDGISGFGTYLETAQVDYPVVTITSPADGAIFYDDETITFTATATDATDGDVSASCDWTAFPDGTLATNDASFTTDALTLGPHGISCVAQDSALNQGLDFINITIIPRGGGDHGPPVIGDDGGSVGGIIVE